MHKNIGLAGVFSIATGAMISSGIFILPGLAFSIAGPAAFLSYMIAGILALLGVLSIIELSTAMPKAGGDYYYINRTFGSLFGTLSGLLGWIALTLKSAFAIFGIAEILSLSFGIPVILSAAALCFGFFLLNIAGVKEAIVFQIIMVAGLLVLLIGFVALGVPRVELSQFDGLFSKGFNQIIIASGFIFVSFGGLLKVANISEEVHNPKRNLPLGMILSVAVVTMLYGLIVIVLTGVLEPAEFESSLTPVADAARIFAGTPGYIAILIASMLAFITTANAGLMSASRYPLALSRDGLLPHGMGRVSRKKHIPIVALSLTSALMFLALLLPLELLVKAASTVILTSYVLTNMAVIILRESGISNYKPSFKTPFYPWLQVGSILLFSYFIVDLGADATEISLIFLLACFLLYFFYGRKKSNGEYALLHLMKKITDHRLTDDLLETELRDILISRDEIEQDAFDSLVRNAAVRDVDKQMTFENLLDHLSEDLISITGLDKQTVKERYLTRQVEYNTAISDFLAIPHILIDGENRKFMLIVRSKKGIDFGEGTESVKAIFLLGGTQDMRVLHLRTIASIASLISQPGFQDEWLDAKKESDLKHLMLLSKRSRYSG
jgi:APA family basic amino acid/polyamine antiporter